MAGKRVMKNRHNRRLLHFQIISIPDPSHRTETVLSQLRLHVEACGIAIKKFELLRIESGDRGYIQDADEFVIAVDGCITKQSQKSTLVENYQLLIEKWMHCTTMSATAQPILCISDDRFFETSRNLQHQIKCSDIKFGTLSNTSHYICYNVCKTRFAVDFRHGVRNIEVTYYSCCNAMMIIPYSSIRKIFVKIGSVVELYLDLLNPPLFYRVEQKLSKYGDCYRLLHRQLTPKVDVSVIGKANVVCLIMEDVARGREIVSRLHFSCGQISVHYVNMHSVEKNPPQVPVVFFSSFDCTYMLTAVLSRNFSVLEQCNDLPSNMIKIFKYCSQNPVCLKKAFADVLFSVDSGKILNFWRAIDALYHYHVENQQAKSFDHYVVPEKSCYVRRVTVTPTRIVLWPEEIMFENRVLRNFNPDYVLLVNLRDENDSRLSFCGPNVDDDIFLRTVKKPLRDGITIGSRHYKFLAWSNSQIRDHSVYMYAKDDKGHTVDSIRRWMGNFSHIKTVSKYMARMGQCFSQTEDTVSVPLDPKHLRTEVDIRHGLCPRTSEPYCFSDGIGRISQRLAHEVQKALGHDKHCSAFQIRYGGYKGMLSVDPLLNDVDIVFRESMKKFDSPENIKLEIARVSKPVPLQLNRPFITLLNQLGVDDRIFLLLQEDSLRKLTDMLLDEDKACHYLHSKVPHDILHFKDIQGSGIGLTTEPFFRSLLLAFHKHHVERIKTRANIPIDPSEGRNMLGILDETGRLNYGEVFVQYTTDIYARETCVGKGRTTIQKGPVIITKNPCLHPGDVRKFMAVDVPELHHIVDCVVFPQRGPRPHPNEMAGSDLDGDEYAVLWKNELIFPSDNVEPAHYPSRASVCKRNIQESDIIDFLCSYIKGDQVGIIANAHLALADDESVFSPTCELVAAKFSIAVDFAKHGNSASLHADEKPERYPDFMENSFKNSYKSRRALGKMYRVCKDFEMGSDLARNFFSVQVDPALVYPGWEKFESSAIKSRNRYCQLLKSVLQTYGVQHEAEVFSGAFTRIHSRFMERRDKAEVEKVVIGSVKALCKNMMMEFLAEFVSDGDLKKHNEALLQKASAWYVVTYRDRNTGFLSFPWIVSKYLANIRIQRLCDLEDMHVTLMPVIEHLNKEIDKAIGRGALPVLPAKAIAVLRQYQFIADRKIVEKALRIMILWAAEWMIIQEPGLYEKGFLYLGIFIKLFMHVAELEHYVYRACIVFRRNHSKNFSPANLYLAFLRFCFTLRFYNKEEADEFLPFSVFRYKALSKIAMQTYHSIAVHGQFDLLLKDSQHIRDKCVEMLFRIESSEFHVNCSFGMSSVPTSVLRRAEENLTRYTGAKEIHMHQERSYEKVIVCAYGNEASLKTLQNILRKRNDLSKVLDGSF